MKVIGWGAVCSAILVQDGGTRQGAPWGSADHLDHFALVADHNAGETRGKPLGAADGTCQGGAVGHAHTVARGDNGEVAGLGGCHGGLVANLFIIAREGGKGEGVCPSAVPPSGSAQRDQKSMASSVGSAPYSSHSSTLSPRTIVSRIRRICSPLLPERRREIARVRVIVGSAVGWVAVFGALPFPVSSL